MSAIKRFARAFKVAMQPPRAPGLDRVRYEPPEFDSSVALENEYTVRASVDGRARDYKLFFLCGHPRSGTNWTGAILNRHPKVNIRGEYRFEGVRQGFDTLTRHFWHVAHDEPARTVAEACFRDTVRRVMAATAEKRPTAEWIGDRTPRALDIFLPGAPHFLIIRDPRDVFVSWTHHELRHGLANFSLPGFREALSPLRESFLADPDYFKKHPERLFCHEGWLKHLTQRWRRHVEFDLNTLDRIDRGELEARVHVIRYEKLHADPEGERRQMYGFLGLDPDEAEPLSSESKSAPGFEKENPDLFYRKGQVGDWQNYFTPDARRWFKEVGGDLLIRLGYEQNDNW